MGTIWVRCRHCGHDYRYTPLLPDACCPMCGSPEAVALEPIEDEVTEPGTMAKESSSTW